MIYWWSIHDISYLFKRHFFGRILSIYLSHILFLYSFISNPPKICQFVFVLCTYKHIVTFIQRVERDIESSFNSKLGNLQLYIVICCTVGFPFFPESFPKLLTVVNQIIKFWKLIMAEFFLTDLKLNLPYRCYTEGVGPGGGFWRKLICSEYINMEFIRNVQPVKFI